MQHLRIMMTINKKLITILIVTCVLLLSIVYSVNLQDDRVIKLVIKKVDIEILTISTVECSVFEEYFVDRYSVLEFKDESYIHNFVSMFNSSEKLNGSFNNFVIDTRAVVELHFADRRIAKICIGNVAYASKGSVFRNTDKIRYELESMEK